MFGNVYVIERQMYATVSDRLVAAAQQRNRPAAGRQGRAEHKRAVWHIGPLTVVWQER